MQDKAIVCEDTDNGGENTPTIADTYKHWINRVHIAGFFYFWQGIKLIIVFK